jgi:hypothetical protein
MHRDQPRGGAAEYLDNFSEIAPQFRGAVEVFASE